jgi:hypothetical protein
MDSKKAISGVMGLYSGRAGLKIFSNWSEREVHFWKISWAFWKSESFTGL